MHEKNNKMFGGVETKYTKELAAVTLASFALARATAEVLTEMYRDDSDHGDGLTNFGEYESGTVPNDADSDGDGLADGREVVRPPPRRQSRLAHSGIAS